MQESRDRGMLRPRFFAFIFPVQKGGHAQTERYEYPFSVLVGQGKLKTALLLNLVEPRLDGVLTQREKGTAKSAAVRGLAELMDGVEVAEGCPFRCRMDGKALCDECRPSPARRAVPYRRRVVELSVGTTEDRVVGTLDLERALKEGIHASESGLLAQANGNILCVDEISLLKDHIVDVLLGSATTGVSTVERKGIFYSHPARFILMDTMNPEGEDLWPQLLDRSGPMMEVHGEQEAGIRREVAYRRLAFEENPVTFCARQAPEQEILRRRIESAWALLPQVSLPEPLFDTVARVYTVLQMGSHRADITMLKTARALATLGGRAGAGMEELRRAAELALPHRLRRALFEQARDADIG